MNRVRMRLPATSANLGPGFDTLALGLELYLEIDAEAAEEFSVSASGRNADVCGANEDNLLITTFEELLTQNGRPVVPLRIVMRNEIPLGMGCGSSAAVRLAAVALAAHFGGLDWERERILAEACRLEGHPDNASACWLGGVVASSADGDGVQAVSLTPPAAWRAVIVMPEKALATTASRSMLPEMYARRDVVANLQRVALLTAAFAAGRADLLAHAMRDWVHQPYREVACPLLPKLLPLAGQAGIAGVALSGAGPAVLFLTVSATAATEAADLARETVGGSGEVEVLVCGLATGAAEMEVCD